jgi:NAD-dependent histone deacetylase SIR2
MAQANAGPVMVQEAVDVSSHHDAAASDAKADPTSSNPTAHRDDADEGDAWDSGSLLEELLDEADVYEYPADGEPHSPADARYAH